MVHGSSLPQKKGPRFSSFESRPGASGPSTTATLLAYLIPRADLLARRELMVTIFLRDGSVKLKLSLAMKVRAASYVGNKVS